MNVLFRVDASTQIGSGHVMRCLAFAAGLKEKNVGISFVCRDHQGQMSSQIQSRGFHCELLPASEKIGRDEGDPKHGHWLGADYRLDAEQSIAACGNSTFDWIIIDHYGIDYRWHLLLREYSSHIMVIDDLADRKHDCDLLLDQTYGRKAAIYDQYVPDNCLTLIGTQYALLRPEFRELRAQTLQARKSRDGIQNILVFMGGADKNNHSSVVLGALAQINWPSKPRVTLVVGAQADHIDQLQGQVASHPLEVIILRDVKNMANLMAIADLGIGAGGTTSWERCCLGLPSLVCIVAENQRTLTQSLDKEGALLSWETEGDLIEQLNILVAEPAFLRKMSKVAARICDGGGCGRVVSALLSSSEDME